MNMDFISSRHSLARQTGSLRTSPLLFSTPSISQHLRIKPLEDLDTEVNVSVVIPCYNYARYLPMAVDSVLSQEGVAVDVIIVDDASTDDSLAVANRLAAREPRIVVVRHETNAGPVKTFNDGLALARGEYLVRLDADDLLTPGSLRRAAAVMSRYPSVGMVYGHPLHFSGDALPVSRTVPSQWTIWPGRQWLWDRCRSGYNVITSPEVMMRRSVVDLVGGQEPLDHTHDMEMWMRLSAFSDVAYIHGADQAWHREHERSLSATKVDLVRDLLERRDAFVTLFAGPAGRIPQAARLHDAAFGAIAAHAVEFACRQFDHRGMDPRKVETFRDIARSLVADIEQIPGWRGLERRMAMRPVRARLDPRFFVQRAARSLRNSLRDRRWHRMGV